MDHPAEDEPPAEAELDDLALRILTLMNQYIDCKRNIENYIKSGCLDLAKARYIAGNRSISALQLPGEDSVGVTAKFRITRPDDDDFPQFESVIQEPDAEETVVENMKQMNLNSDNTVARRILRSSNDPLKWFGCLVPRNLRQSKVTFEKCLEIVIECANIQSELERSMTEFKSRKHVISKKL